MNVLDVLIIIFAIAAIFRGLEIGFVRQFFSTAGFIGGLWLGALLQPHFIHLAHSETSKSALTLGLTLGVAFLLLGVGEYIGVFIKRKILHNIVNPVDYAAGAILGLSSLVIGVWLSASIFSSMPFPPVQQAISQSRIVRLLNSHLPSAPNIIADIGHLIDPNGFPDVFSGIEPAPSEAVEQPGLEGFQTAIAAAQASVVRIAGQGCGGIVEGSGFVVDKDLVVTNAHVVAGIRHIVVQDQNGNHTAVAIWFDANLDLAVLRVSGLKGTPLKFDASSQPRGTAAAVLGYPGGGGFTARSAAILSTFTATGHNIYGTDQTRRSVYELQADIIPGNSGGPLISEQGKVIGVIFAESTSYKDIGYALTPSKVIASIQSAKEQNHARDTASCAE
ncbi:acid resistance serine protease MarP [soil metagenome]